MGPGLVEAASRRRKARERLLARLDRLRDRARRRSEGFIRWRIAVFAAALAVGFLGYAGGRTALTGSLLISFGLVFAVLLFFHSRLKASLRRLEIWIGIQRAHLARQALEWDGLPPARDYGISEGHPFAHDLDLVGPHSLLRLIDTTVSTHGRRQLVTRLLYPDPDPGSSERGQGLVRELVPRPLLCDRLVLEARRVSSDGELKSDEMIRALESPGSTAGLGAMLAVGAVLSNLTAIFLFWEFALGGSRWWGFTFLPYLTGYFLIYGRIEPVFGRALDLRRHLERVRDLFRLIETRKDPMSPNLREATRAFHEPGMRPSEWVGRIARIADALSVRGNPLVHLILNAAGPWDLYFTYRYERVRDGIVEHFPLWLEALGRLEASAALARYARLHPDYVFPVINPPKPDPPRIRARGLGHPLIPDSRRVVNDFGLEHLGSVMLLTGSNMSGKSTFLRTVGINAAMALAGGPVCAEAFSMPVLRLFCGVRIRDDLEEGLSYFYAEVKRLKRILDAAAERSGPPVLFLIDEIYKGTNNRERLLGSTAYIKKLLESRGLGLVSTHDLELASLEGEVKGVRNFHFQERVAEGRLLFDYRLLPGPCPTTNALRIMAREGLPVPPDSSD